MRSPLRLLRKAQQLGAGGYQLTYSQHGEDVIVASLLAGLQISEPSYLDIGAHSPRHLNNTYRFYCAGHSGTCIEANPFLHAELIKVRPRDRSINVGVGPESCGSMKFYVMEPSTLSTFSRETAESLHGEDGHRIVKVVDVPVMSINDIRREFVPCTPHFVSLDVEGLDLRILESWKFSEFRPDVLCVETLTYSTTQQGRRKESEVLELLQERGYHVFADTYINTIVVDAERLAASRGWGQEATAVPAAEHLQESRRR